MGYMDVGGASHGEYPISHSPVGANGEADRDSPGIVQNRTTRDARVAPTGAESIALALYLCNLCNLWIIFFKTVPETAQPTRV